MLIIKDFCGGERCPPLEHNLSTDCERNFSPAAVANYFFLFYSPQRIAPTSTLIITLRELLKLRGFFWAAGSGRQSFQSARTRSHLIKIGTLAAIRRVRRPASRFRVMAGRLRAWTLAPACRFATIKTGRLKYYSTKQSSGSFRYAVPVSALGDRSFLRDFCCEHPPSV